LLAELSVAQLRPVLNATGVVLHTNLGRAPLAAEALAAALEVGRGYSNLELDLETGERGSRFAPLVEGLRRLTGAEDALVVNNCAGATLLVLTALAEGREVVVSRGDLVEIGGGFRVPDVMRQSHATLVEVGTTNRTRRADYERALTSATALVTKVHRSNFALVGFTEDTSVEELARLCQPRGLPLFVDAGSGLLEALAGEGLAAEPTMRAHLEAGADLVPSRGPAARGLWPAGVVVGRAAWIARLRSHPLARALRIDKLTVAALRGDPPPVPRWQEGAHPHPGDGRGLRAGAPGACDTPSGTPGRRRNLLQGGPGRGAGRGWHAAPGPPGLLGVCAGWRRRGASGATPHR
jgi:L-seryl-tRNA(Ser) seleniumtransferase